jgi:hypothetical protein
MCGTRTTLREVTGWRHSPNHSILIVEAGDKFGGMGLVSAAVTVQMPDKIRIPVFVMSCRVFGYGVERALLNYIRHAALGSGGAGKPVVGLYLDRDCIERTVPARVSGERICPGRRRMGLPKRSGDSGSGLANG